MGSSVRVSAKGSYANNTNVRLDSDVDVAVEWRDQFKVDYFGDAVGKTSAQLGYTSATDVLSADELRGRVQAALVSAFGSGAVDASGKTAIRVKGGANTLDADVVPCFALHRYYAPHQFHEGQRLFPRGGGYKDNWPEQNKTNGNKKNTATGHRYKGLIRAVKRLENEMLDQKVLPAEVPGYLIECLVWNVPNADFGHLKVLSDARHILAHLFNNTRSDNECSEWGEVNELKYLFRPSQKWSRQQAHGFVSAAWDYIGFT